MLIRKSVRDLELEAELDELQAGATHAAPTRPAPAKGYLLGFGIIAVLAAANHWFFRAVFGMTHLEWYLANGAIIGFATSVVATTWGDTNRNVDLISAHPLRYLAACAHMVALPFFALGTQLRRSDDPAVARNPFDIMLTMSFAILVALFLFIWVLVVVPLQYFIYLVCGAPARLHLQSEWRPVARQSRTAGLRMDEVAKADPLPKGWWDASLFARPVSITGLMSSILFFVLGFFMPG